MDFNYLKTIRDQVLFVAGFFSVFGLLTTDSYYNYFGIKYQFLNLGTAHILYRGFTLIYFNIMFVTIFLIILMGVLLSRFRFKIAIGRKLVEGEYAIYAFLGVAMAAGCYISFTTGIETAARDMYLESTTLRQLTKFYSRDSDKLGFVTKMIGEGVVLLLRASGDQIVIFHPIPNTYRLSRPMIEVHHIGLSSDDFYSDRPTE
jgi:hypothetical protein